MGSFQGVFSKVPATELGAIATKAVVERAGISPQKIEQLLFGCVLPAGLGQSAARQVALKAGLPVSTPSTLISKACGSGMQALICTHDQIIAGSYGVAIAGGMENMSRAPYLLQNVRSGKRIDRGEIQDHLFFDGLQDPDSGRLMGSFAQETADRYGIARVDMDAYAAESLWRAQKACKEGDFAEEMAAVPITQNGEPFDVVLDEPPGNVSLEKISQLKPVFKEDGTITAANSSSISDGAAALLLMSESEARVHQVQPLARLVAHAYHAREPGEFPIAPVDAITQVLQRAGWEMTDVDLFEINEAFAVVPMIAMRELGIDRLRLNISGGACALGHPIGASGARIVVTLCYALKRLNKKRGVAAICIGGGEATAVAIELI